MNEPLPSLNALRAFEAVGRLGSVTAAASELHVTPAAVSHQVKTLEAHLGVTLIERVGNELRITEAGRAALPELRQAFELLERAAVRMAAPQSRLSLSVAPVFASTWLVPHLGEFHEAQPRIDVRVSSSVSIADLRRDGFDAAIRLGREPPEGLCWDLLFGDEVVPMCSPDLCRGRGALKRPEDLARATLIHTDWPGGGPHGLRWSSWLDHVGVTGVDVERGPRFTEPDYAMEAAAQGVGVVLGWRFLAQADLKEGRLQIPFARPLAVDVAFRLVYEARTADRADFAAFRSWLLAAVARPARTVAERTPPAG
jgi:LysR family glycine cleavage system transcriptional activator